MEDTSMESMECSRCRKRSDQQTESFIECSDCKAVLYCTEACRLADWDDLTTTYSHKNWCQKFHEYMQNENKLCSLPFSFTHETTSRSFSKKKLKELLRKYDVCNQGFWRRECEETRGKPVLPYGLARLTIFSKEKATGDLMVDQSSYVLPGEQSILTSPPTTTVPITSPLGDWAEYYSWRGLDANSPVSQLLSYPLSVYYILTTCLKQDNSDHFESLLKKDMLRIVLLGVEKEVEMIPVFKELVNLLPGVSVHIDMVGKSISKNCRRKIFQDGQLSCALFRGDYHSWEGHEADIIIGLNAGIAAYRSWQPTIEKILKQKIPAYFTEYCEYFVDITDLSLKGADSGEVTQRRLNPFRTPFRITSEDNYLPSFSNAVIFSLSQR